MTINIIYEQPTGTAPAGFYSDTDLVVNYLENLFTNNASIYLELGYGEFPPSGTTMGGGVISESSPATYRIEDYSTILSILLSQDAPGASYLPETSPASSSNIYVPLGQYRGLTQTQSSEYDGYIGESSTVGMSYTPYVKPPSGDYYFIGSLEHEITVMMGRESQVASPPISVLDLFRFASNGTYDFTDTDQTYFSVNGGSTFLQAFEGNPSSGDLGGWSGADGNDMGNAYYTTGVIEPFTSADITAMEAIGWTVDTDAPTISSIVSSTTDTTATITWSTDLGATSTVEYGTSPAYGSASSTSLYATSTSLTLTGLSSGTTYHFRADSTSAYGTEATSSDYTFTTTGGGGASAPARPSFLEFWGGFFRQVGGQVIIR